MWVSKKIWKEMEKLTRTGELTGKMKKIANDYADLIIEDIKNATRHSPSADSGRISEEVAEIRHLYEQLMSRIYPLYVYTTKKENEVYMFINIIIASIAVAAAIIAMIRR